MDNFQKFDAWFDTLSESEQGEIVAHIISSKLEVTLEGLFVGPSGQRIAKGLFAGPAGLLSNQTCPVCGK